MAAYPTVNSSESSDREIGYGKSENLFCIGKYLQEKCLAIFFIPAVLMCGVSRTKRQSITWKIFGIVLTTVDPQLLLFLDKTKTFSRSFSVKPEGSSGR